MTTQVKNVIAIVIALLVLSFGMRHFVSANWYHHKAKPGTTISEVFRAVDGWNTRIGNLQRRASDPDFLFHINSENSGTYGIHISNHPGSELMESKEKLIETVQKQMSEPE